IAQSYSCRRTRNPDYIASNPNYIMEGNPATRHEVNHAKHPDDMATQHLEGPGMPQKAPKVVDGSTFDSLSNA
ncbi:hypothetical protein Ancab_033691, partial [Ancistrocladus abbreviatus]